jgi:ribonuclease BN (tRNA processing enzyme)
MVDVPPLEVCLLGSGGPFANPTRVSSGSLVFVDGVPSILVDAGGGVFERLGRLGADPAQIDDVLVTHTHIDHSGGLAPVVFAAAMADRARPFRLFGPAGREQHPGAVRFASLLFGENGAWSYLHTFTGFGCDAYELPSAPGATTELEHRAVRIRSVGVSHGMMPSLAFRIDHAGRSVVFGGDVDHYEPSLAELARGCDLLIHDFALPERDVPHGNLHAKPSAVGRLAADAECGTLLLTHFMPEIEDELDEAVEHVRASFSGEIVLAHDLLRLVPGGGRR